MQLRNPDGSMRDARLIGIEIPEQIRAGLGWALFDPVRTEVRKSPASKQYRVTHAELGEVSPDISPAIMGALMVLRVLNPHPEDPNVAVGNPMFLSENPMWRVYIPAPKGRGPPKPGGTPKK